VVFALKFWRQYLYSVYCKVFPYILIKRNLNLRQWIWLEFLKDYGMTVIYHFGKVNVIEDALGWKTVSMGSLPFLHVGGNPLSMNVQSLSNNLMRLGILKPGNVLAYMEVTKFLLYQIRVRQFGNESLCKIWGKVLQGTTNEEILYGGGVLSISCHMCISRACHLIKKSWKRP